MSTIPAGAKKVFDAGIVFEIYHWEQELFNGKKTTFEMAKRLPSAYVLPIIGDRILLSNQKQPHEPVHYATLLGGRTEKGEDPLEGAKRELLEESGCIAKQRELWFIDEGSDKMERKKYYYIARDLEKVSEVHLDGGEDMQLIELSFEELVERFCNRNYNDYIGLKLELLHSEREGTLDTIKRKLFGDYK